VHGRLQSIKKILAGILGALPQTADAHESAFAHSPEGQYLSSIQGKETLSDSPEEAADIVNTTLDQQVKANNIQVSFSVLPEILQHLIDPVTVAKCASAEGLWYTYYHWYDCDYGHVFHFL
jgi:hypothetical protein